MLRKVVIFSALLASSLSVSAEIVDLGKITRDTRTGLDWLDLTETNHRSYEDISNKFDVGQEFEGWRYASGQEALTVWSSFGVTTPSTTPISMGALEYTSFINAVDTMGNIMSMNFAHIDYGLLGIVTDETSVGSKNRLRIGAIHFTDETLVDTRLSTNINLPQSDTSAVGGVGSYLVRTSVIPIPAAAWLFGSALIGLTGIKRNKGSAGNK